MTIWDDAFGNFGGQTSFSSWGTGAARSNFLNYHGLQDTGFDTRFNASFPNRSASGGSSFIPSSSSGMRYSDAGYGTSTGLSGVSDVVAGAISGSGGGSGETSPTDVIGNRLRSFIPNPFLSNQVQGGREENVDVGVQPELKSFVGGIGDSIAAWIPRIVLIVLGLIFVAIGLSMFGVPVGPTMIKNVASKIPQ